jgi:hypothetical protein
MCTLEGYGHAFSDICQCSGCLDLADSFNIFTQIAHVHMHAKCEDVVRRLATLLSLRPLPDFQREDIVQLTFTEELPAAKASTGFAIRLSSPHSDRHITPLVQSADVSFPVRLDQRVQFTVRTRAAYM